MCFDFSFLYIYISGAVVLGFRALAIWGFRGPGLCELDSLNDGGSNVQPNQKRFM